MTTCPDQDALRHYSLGAVRESEAADLESHLAACPHCVETLHDLQAPDTLVDAMRAQSTMVCRPRVDEIVTQLMVVLKGLQPPVSQHGSESCTAQEPIDFLAPPEQPDEIGRLASCRILRILGSGGMGVVFEAEDMHLRRRVALKTLRPLLASSAAARKRFLREARAAAKITHDNVVTIYHVGEDRGIPFLTMPCLAGETLEARLRRAGPLPLADIVRIGRELAEGLSAAHAQGLLHRDIKPANLWLESADSSPQAVDSTRSASRTKILDFGLAWVADENDALTEHGAVIGTPSYMAPEQARGEPASVRSDLFSLGSVLYAMCTGQAPFQASSNFATLEKVRTQAPRPIGAINPALPQWLTDLVSKLLAKDPSDRCQSAAEVVALLQPSVPRAAESKPRRWWPAAAALLLLPIVGLTLCEATGVTHLHAIITSRPEQPDLPKIVENPPKGEPKGLAIVAGGSARPAKDPDLKPVPIDAPDEMAPTVYPAAIFKFEERGKDVDGHGAKVADLLFASLARRPDLHFVDRADLKKILSELELNVSGIVKPAEATKIGQVTGAKLLISGSVLQVDKKTYLIAKIVGTETSRMLAASVDGKATEELGPLVEKLAEQVAKTITEKSDQLVAKVVPAIDRIAVLKTKLNGSRPSVMVQRGAEPDDGTAQTEIAKFCKETGFTLIDPEEGSRFKADVTITVQVLTEVAARRDRLIGVAARVTIKATSKGGEILAADRQTALVVHTGELSARKAAVEEATATLAERVLPKLVKQ